MTREGEGGIGTHWTPRVLTENDAACAQADVDSSAPVR